MNNICPFAFVICLAIGFTLSSPANAFQDKEPLKSLGINRNGEISESSGLANSTYVKDAIWTHNDSGHAPELFLLKTNGKLLATITLVGVRNIDWEAMTQFSFRGTSYLMVADVGDNLRRRKSCLIHILPEPRLTLNENDDSVRKTSIKPTTIEFSYEDGPRNCEAACVNIKDKQIWFVEKVYYERGKDVIPGIYSIPLTVEKSRPLTARRIGDFPIRNVTGMSFSNDQEHLIIRNYLSAHLYSRDGRSWPQTIKSKPTPVVLPIQRQGEAICFSPDSKSVIVSSEVSRQPIWQVSLQKYLSKDASNALELTGDQPAKKETDGQPDN